MVYGGYDRLADRLPAAIRQHTPAVLTVVAFAVVLVVLTPFLWLVLHAGTVPQPKLFEILTSPTTVSVTINTIVLVLAVTGSSILLGVPLAVLTVQTDLPFRRFWTVTSALPLVVPSYIGAFTFDSALGIHGLFGTVFVLTLFTYPYVFLTTRASLLSFDGTVVEAARSLNATRWRAFRRVTLPQILPGVAAGSLLVALYALSDFGTPTIMRYDVFTRTIFNDLRGRSEYAAVRSLLLLAMAGAIVVLGSRIEADSDGAYVSRGARRPGEIRLGLWKAPAIAFCGAVATLCLVLPVAILLQWLGRGEARAGYAAMAFESSYAYNSMLLSAGAAAVCVLVALPIAYVAARSDTRIHSLPDRLSYVGYAAPGVVLGLALVYTSIRYVPPLYYTYAPVLLVFAYVVRFLPQAVGATKSSLLQVDPSYVEAARSLGTGPLVSFKRVVLPLVAPGIVAGGALVFLTTMKELPATLILRPAGFETIVTHVWMVQEAGLYGRAAVPALVLIVVSGLSMLAILGRERYNAPQ